jgi:hypothetical protein
VAPVTAIDHCGRYTFRSGPIDPKKISSCRSLERKKRERIELEWHFHLAVVSEAVRAVEIVVAEGLSYNNHI